MSEKKSESPGFHAENASLADAEIFCDGASSGNPGPSGIGVVIRLTNSSQRQYEISEFIGVATNNIAEYSALLRGLKEARALGLRKIAVFLDSELLVKQLNGSYRVKNMKLRQLWNASIDILRHFDHYTISHIRREFNKKADLLAKNSVKDGSAV
jgi:ribonuclease HI